MIIKSLAQSQAVCLNAETSLMRGPRYHGGGQRPNSEFPDWQASCLKTEHSVSPYTARAFRRGTPPRQSG